MQYTLLEIVQKVLSEMDSDEVNSINDTIESQQVADAVQTLFYDIVSEFNIDGRKTLFQLDASGTTARPTHMTLPANIKELFWIRYNTLDSGETDAEWRVIRYVTPEEFLSRTLGRNQSDSEVDAITDPSGATLYVFNERDPQIWTSFDDSTVVFDAYDSAVDSTLQSSKTLCYGYELPSLTVADGTVPDLPDHLHQLLLREAIDYCTAVWKGKDLEKHRRARAIRSRSRNVTNQINNNYMDERPDFGKKT